MWQKTFGILGCALSAFSCGAAAVPAPKATVAPVADAPLPPAAPAPPALRAASADVARYWIFDGKTQLSLYAGVDSLLHTQLFARLLPDILGQSQELLKATERACAGALTAESRELLLGVDARGGLMILELGPEGVKAVRSACVGSWLPVERVEVTGADEAYGSGKDVVAVRAGVALFGSKALVEAALATKQPAPVPTSLNLKGDQQLAFQIANLDPDLSGGGALRLSPERFRLEADLELPTEELAEMVERKVKESHDQAQQLGQARPDVPVTKLVNALEVQRHGKRFTSAFELREPAAEQAHDLGTLLGLAVYGVRRYVQDAKIAEGRSTIANIARAYAATLQEPPAAGKRPAAKKLVSLPKVPANVPRGVKYQTSADDWQAWSAIHFALTDPQYFQYEVVAAKDGRTAEIFARGDLNGDGKTSLFRIKIELDPKTRAITAVEHTEEAPLE